MWKTIVILITIVIALIPCAICEGISDDLEAVPTTEEQIQFLGLSWGSDIETVYNVVLDSFPDINDPDHMPSMEQPKNEESMASSTFHDPSHRFLERITTENVETTTIGFYKKQKGGPLDGYNFEVGIVAGHPIEAITVNFLNDHDYGLYKAGYTFNTNKGSIIPNEKRYTDLKEKVSVIYGQPHEYHVHIDSPMRLVSGSDGECAVWIGKNGSAAYLYYYKEIGGLYPGTEYLTLQYGTSDCNMIFALADEIAEQEESERIESELDSVTDNNYGL